MVSSAFKVDDVWYEMEYTTLRMIERRIGGQPTNREIVRYVHDNLPSFSIKEANPAGTLFVYISLT